MSKWDYTPEENNRIGVGEYRVAVVDVEEAVSKSGNDMLVITVQPNNSNIKIKHYIVKNEYYNRNMTDFSDSFGIERCDLNFMGWIGAIGAARLKEDENGYLKVAYFLNPTKASRLPEWQGDKPERQTVSTIDGMVESDDDGDLPFI